MLRIQVSSSSAGPSNKTMQVNPYMFDSVDRENLVEKEILHGASVYQKVSLDFRKRTLTWYGAPVSDTNLTDVVDYFKSIKGEIRYFYFGDISSMNDTWPSGAETVSSASWKKARIIDLSVVYKPGGRIEYDKIELFIQPELV